LNNAEGEDVRIEHRDGRTVSVRLVPKQPSPFDVAGIATGAIAADILAAIEISARAARLSNKCFHRGVK
jgi:hypothetical protein